MDEDKDEEEEGGLQNKEPSFKRYKRYNTNKNQKKNSCGTYIQPILLRLLNVFVLPRLMRLYCFFGFIKGGEKCLKMLGSKNQSIHTCVNCLSM